MYEGNWEDKEHGFGKFVFPNGAVYEGQFVKGKKEGKAKCAPPPRTATATPPPQRTATAAHQRTAAHRHSHSQMAQDQ